MIRQVVAASVLVWTLLAVVVSGDEESRIDVSRVNYQWYCDMELQPVVTLTWNEDQGKYVLPQDYQLERDNDGLTYDDDNIHRRHLKASRRKIQRIGSTAFSFIEPAISWSRSLLESNQDEIGVALNTTTTTTTNNTNTSAITNMTTTTNATRQQKTMEARLCPCWQSLAPRSPDAFFCPVALSHCAIPASHFYYAHTATNSNGHSGSIFSDVENNFNSNNYNNNNNSQYVLEEPGCLTVQQQRRFARSIWPIVTVFYLAIIMCLLCTIPGRHAMGYCCAWVSSDRYNHWVIQRYIRADPDTADRIVFQSMARRPNERVAAIQYRANLVAMQLQQQMQSGTRLWVPPNLRQRQELQLRTKIYTYHSGMQNNGDRLQQSSSSSSSSIQQSSDKGEPSTEHGSNDENRQPSMLSCSICHMEIEEGDRVGDLRCNHIFHVEPCLKSWLVRRNVCPLCLSEKVATPIVPSNHHNHHHRNSDDNGEGLLDDDNDTMQVEMTGMRSSRINSELPTGGGYP